LSRDIFISHAAKDKALAGAVVDMLQLGLNLDANTIFCSSLEDLSIPSGVNFVEHLKTQIQSPKVVIALISPNYLASQFCLCELGASWVMSHRLFPLLVPPLKSQDVHGVLTGVQLTALDSEERLSELRDQLVTALEVKGTGTARWEAKRKVFLRDLHGVLAGLPAPAIVSSADHDRVKEDLEDAQEYIDQLEEDLKRKAEMIAKLSAARDPAEVRKIKMACHSDTQRLNELERTLSGTLSAVSKAVAFVAYRELALGQHPKIDSSKDPDFTDEIQRAKEQQLVDIDEDGFCTLDGSHPKIKAIESAFRELRMFLQGDIADLEEEFANQHEVPMRIDNRDYWQLRLDKRISRVYA
jgi:hypothetical protein